MSVRNTLINFSLLCLSIIFFLGCLEILVRVTGIARTTPAPIQAIQQSSNPLISYELQPNSNTHSYGEYVSVNSFGFRGNEYDSDKPYIAVLGDSITFGYNLPDDESIPAHMQLLLPEYNVINAAVPGYNIEQEVQTYIDKVAAFNPEKLVIIFFFNDADLDTAVLDKKGFLRPKDWRIEDRTCTPIRTGIMNYLPFKCWLDLNSAFYVALEKVVHRLHLTDQLEEKRQQEKQAPSTDPFTAKHVADYKAIFEQFAQGLPSDQQKLFVIWPDYHMHTESIPQLIALAEKSGFSVLNFYDYFENNIETLPGDSIHPTGAMSKKAATAIVEALERPL